MRVGLGLLALVTILSGQFVASGTVYILSFMGIAGAVVLALKGLEPPGDGISAVMFAGPALIIAVMVVLYSGLLVGIGTSLYISFRRQSGSVAPRFAQITFIGLAVCTSLGLVLSRWLESRPEHEGEPLYHSYYFVWPLAFCILAFLYGKLFPKRDKA